MAAANDFGFSQIAGKRLETRILMDAKGDLFIDFEERKPETVFVILRKDVMSSL